TVLTEKGAPTPVAWTRLRAPQASMEPAPEATLTSIVEASPAMAEYGTPVDNVSAYEMLVRRIDQEREAREAAERAEEAAEQAEKDRIAAEKLAAKEAAAAEKARLKAEADAAARAAKDADRNAKSRRSALDSLLRSAGSVIGREVSRSIFGTRRR